ncbi:MAG: kynureninase [Gammaproteobacteria bacterium]|nr:kynureninase [Gammaproteobacteria bacterium]
MDRLLDEARRLDREDALRHFRGQFCFPVQGDGSPQTYFCGHSLGLQPRAVETAMQEELRAWRDRAVGGHFKGSPAWIDYADGLAEMMSGLTGASPSEISVMNTLSVNLHLMMVSFYRPTGRRRKILIEAHAFPSDRYAVASQIRFHGLDPEECLLELGASDDGRTIEESDIEALLRERGEEIALVLWPGLQYASGQRFDLQRIASAARKAGARVGFDLAHSIGNVPLDLHGSGCDFAAWCTYKYLNGGPGAVGACFVHERHGDGAGLPRFEGWWGNDRGSRFRMSAEFSAAPGADAWQLSNPPILAMTPLRVSIGQFREAGMDRLRAKSRALTGWLESRIVERLDPVLDILTPRDPARRGCQLSLRVRSGRAAGRRLFEYLESRGVITDWREPDVIRIAPVPLYNNHEDCLVFVRGVEEWAAGEGGSA